MKPRPYLSHFLTCIILSTVGLNACTGGAGPVVEERSAAPGSLRAAATTLSEQQMALLDSLPGHIAALLPPAHGGEGRPEEHNQVFKYMCGLSAESWEELGAKAHRRFGHRADEERSKLSIARHEECFRALEEEIATGEAMGHEEFVRKVYPHLSRSSRKLLPQELLDPRHRDRFGGGVVSENKFYLALRNSISPRPGGSLPEADIRRAVTNFEDRGVKAARKATQRDRRKEIKKSKRGEGGVRFVGDLLH